jgi:hypothetical protein
MLSAVETPSPLVEAEAPLQNTVTGPDGAENHE